MQFFLYLCSQMRQFITILCCFMLSLSVYCAQIEDIIDDVYRQLTEMGEVDYEELQEELMQYAVEPIDLNNTSAEELKSLRFLNEQQVDAILLYVYKHPMESVEELDLIAELQPYEIRNLKAFVTVKPAKVDYRPIATEVFHYAKHEVLARVDAHNIERNQSDPVYAQVKYKFNYANRVQFGAGILRETGTPAKDLHYGAYLQLNDIAAHVKTIVAGNYQASFGQGIVLNTGFHAGKSQYAMTAGIVNEGLKKYSSSSISPLHGAGATFAFGDIWGLKTEFSVLYSLGKSNDSVWRHTIGGNLTFKHQRFKAGITAVENIYSDSLRYYYESAAYNQHYFRGIRQAVVGANFRYNHGWFDVFGEVATAQNKGSWGVGTEIGCRFTPASDIGLLVLYRYYSPHFDNPLGYGFSETSRINDENGAYIGAEIKRVRNWRFEIYGDVFYFSGIKYGINYAPSLGYDVMGQAEWLPQSSYGMLMRFRAREKGRISTYSLRYQFNYDQDGWRLRTEANGNLVQDSARHLSWGIELHQDVQYSFARVPLTLQLRLQGFHARNWNNRIYVYENDVLYSFSIPAVYGIGGRAYLNLRWRIIPQLSLYLKVSETIYARSWATIRDIPTTRTEIHLLLRALL